MFQIDNIYIRLLYFRTATRYMNFCMPNISDSGSRRMTEHRLQLIANLARSDSLPKSKTQVGAAKSTTAGAHPDIFPPISPFNKNSQADSWPISPRTPLVVFSQSMTTLLHCEWRSGSAQGRRPRPPRRPNHQTLRWRR